jgi:cytochrome P450 family 138
METNLPPGPRLPAAIQGLAFTVSRRRAMQRMRRRYGAAYSARLPLFGPAVFLNDPVLIKQLFMTSTDLVGNLQPNLGRVLGPGSFFSLDGEAHKRQRKLLVPPFHGRRMKEYEEIIADEAHLEMATWPEGVPFSTLQPMMRITLNIILRAVFGAEGAEFEALRKLIPPMVELGSKIALVGKLPLPLGRFDPWRRFARYRQEFDEIVGKLIADTLADPHLDERKDVLSLMLQARYDDGEPISQQDIADQLTTLLAAGHETTATTLAWAIERLSRHPDALDRMTDPDYRQAAIIEVQRVRPVIDLTGRRVKADHIQLGEWVIPRGHSLMVGIGAVHEDDSVFPDAGAFRPERFLGSPPDSYEWIPFGGGTRRCIGAAFANMEMNVVLRTLLNEFELVTTTAPGERWHNRGVAYAPAKGGLAVVHRRSRTAANDTRSERAPIAA